jgi:hypothetical protein
METPYWFRELFLEAQAKKMFAGAGIFAAVLLTGGIAVFHGGLISLGSADSSTVREQKILMCESEIHTLMSAGAIPGIDECVQGAQAGDTHKSEPAGSATHSITVKFDYDFTRTPVCGGKLKLKDSCVSNFIVYDISGPKPYRLFSIPAPPDAKGLMKGITATSPRMLFVIGKHRIGVAAVSASGKESPPFDCDIVVAIGPDAKPATAQ